MKRINSKCFNIVALFLFGILATSSICFSYLFGSSSQSVKFYSCLMSVDSKVKKQNNDNFLHGSFDCIDMNENDEYNIYLNLQRKTKSNYAYYNSFLVSSLDNKPLVFNTDFKINESTKTFNNLVQVATYYDAEFMEAIGLPIFKNEKDTKSTGHVGINPKNGADYGAYISASSAEIIVTNNGMLEESIDQDLSSTQILRDAFTKLLNDESFKFEISNPNIEDGKLIKLSVNAIYLDCEHTDLLTDSQKQVGTRMYNDYYETFEYWFKDSIFTFAPKIFNKGSSYYFDIRKNYGNLDRFFTYVSGFDYAKENMIVTFFAENGSILEESGILNKASLYRESSSRYVWLILSIITSAMIIFFRDFFDKKYSYTIKFLLSGMLFFVFCFGQLAFYLLLNCGFKKYILYNIFNSSGNILILASLILILANEIIWRLYVRKN